MLRASRVEHGQGQRPGVETVGEVVHLAHGRIRQTRFRREEALRRDGHPHHVGVLRQDPDLGGRLEPGPPGLGVDATVPPGRR